MKILDIAFFLCYNRIKAIEQQNLKIIGRRHCK